MTPAQAIPVLVINLARRQDRLQRLGGQLERLGIGWQRVDALDVLAATPADLDPVIAKNGPLGPLGDGDRACMVSHMRAWSAFLATDAGFALVLEDDAYLAADARSIVADAGWIPEGVDVVKLEKFGEGASTILIGPAIATLPAGRRTLHRLLSRHVGGAAYIVSRRAAAEALKMRGQLRVPVDHLLFNGNVSALARRLKPTVVRPAMATQRQYGYSSDVKTPKALRPTGWRRRMRSLKRGYYDVRLIPLQVILALSGRARLMPLTWQERTRDPTGTT